MITEKAEMQGWERFFISGSILNVQESASEKVSLANSSVLAWDSQGTDVSTTFLDQTSKALATDPKKCETAFMDNMLTILVRDGDETKSPYKVTFRMQTTQGNRYEVDMRVGVNEI